jgi:hypothetical protein
MAVFHAIGRARLFVGQAVKKVVRFTGGAVNKVVRPGRD